MLDPENVPEISDDEVVARYILQSNEFRKNDNTVKPTLFLPYSKIELSVNRHTCCNEDEIWQFGTNVATARNKTLHGRSDIAASACNAVTPLRVVAKPIIPDNPNHADVINYPESKEDQLALAQKLAASASKRIEAP